MSCEGRFTFDQNELEQRKGVDRPPILSRGNRMEATVAYTIEKDRGEPVPLALVMPHVQDWIDAWYGVGGGEIPRGGSPYVTPEAVRREHPEWGRSGNESLPVLLLASAAGLIPSTIGGWLRRWARGEGTQTIGYFDADALFTAMHKTGLWAQDDRLRAVRDAANLTATLSEPPTEGTS